MKRQLKLKHKRKYQLKLLLLLILLLLLLLLLLLKQVTCGLTVIVGNGLGNLSSNLRQGCWLFT